MSVPSATANRASLPLAESLLTLCTHDLEYLVVPEEIERFSKAIDTLENLVGTLNALLVTRAPYLTTVTRLSVNESGQRAEHVLQEIRAAIQRCKADFVPQGVVIANQHLQWMLHDYACFARNNSPLDGYIQNLRGHVSRLEAIQMSPCTEEAPPPYSEFSDITVDSSNSQPILQGPSARRRHLRNVTQSNGHASELTNDDRACRNEHELAPGSAWSQTIQGPSSIVDHPVYELPISIERFGSVRSNIAKNQPRHQPSRSSFSAGSTNTMPILNELESSTSRETPRINTLPEDPSPREHMEDRPIDSSHKEHTQVRGEMLPSNSSFLPSGLPVSIGIDQSQSYSSWYATRNVPTVSITTSSLTHSASLGARSPSAQQQQYSYPAFCTGLEAVEPPTPLTHSVSVNTGTTQIYPGWSPPRPLTSHSNASVSDFQVLVPKKRYKSGFI